MNNRHKITLQKINRQPIPADIRWQEIVSLLEAVGVELSQGSGSRVRLKAATERMVVHQPHPGPNTGKATIRDIAKFLKKLGIVPKQERGKRKTNS